MDTPCPYFPRLKFTRNLPRSGVAKLLKHCANLRLIQIDGIIVRADGYGFPCIQDSDKGGDAMAQTMIASGKTMTSGQINDALAKLRAAFEKHRSEIPSDAAQAALGTDNIGMSMFAPFRQLAEMVSKLIVRQVEKVNRSRSGKEMLDATGRTQYVNDEVVAAMPRGEGDGAEVIVFMPEPEEYDHDGWISDEALDRAYEKRGLMAADPYSLGAVNEADPAFADDKPHGTHWKDAQGKWCYAAFYRWNGKRSVSVDRSGGAWGAGWVFAGVRKVSLAPAV